jgi:predicted nucleic acid-binding protein
MLHAWDNYPVVQFPSLWEWMAGEVSSGRLSMSSVAIDEVKHKSIDCHTWLKENQITAHPITNAIVQDAMRMKVLLGIVDDGYHVKGVDENDLLIIATARTLHVLLVTNESRQYGKNTLPRSKIPAVCEMPSVHVPCINFLEWLKASGEVF